MFLPLPLRSKQLKTLVHRVNTKAIEELLFQAASTVGVKELCSIWTRKDMTLRPVISGLGGLRRMTMNLSSYTVHSETA